MRRNGKREGDTPSSKKYLSPAAKKRIGIWGPKADKDFVGGKRIKGIG